MVEDGPDRVISLFCVDDPASLLNATTYLRNRSCISQGFNGHASGYEGIKKKNCFCFYIQALMSPTDPNFFCGADCHCRQARFRSVALAHLYGSYLVRGGAAAPPLGDHVGHEEQKLLRHHGLYLSLHANLRGRCRRRRRRRRRTLCFGGVRIV